MRLFCMLFPNALYLVFDRFVVRQGWVEEGGGAGLFVIIN